MVYMVYLLVSTSAYYVQAFFIHVFDFLRVVSKLSIEGSQKFDLN